MESKFVWLFVIVFYSILTLLIIWARSRSFEFTPFGCWNKCNSIGWRARKHTFNRSCMICFVFRSYVRSFVWSTLIFTECYTLLARLCSYMLWWYLYGIVWVWMWVCMRVSIYVFDRVVRSYNNTLKYFTFVSHQVILLSFALRF